MPDLTDPVDRTGMGSAYGTGATVQPELAGGPRTDGDIADRVRRWYVEAYQHEFWKAYRANREEDIGFYVGGRGQWSMDYSTEQYQRLKDQGRAVVSINLCQPQIELLVGYERSNRFDLRASPQGGEDVEDAELFSLLLKVEQDRAEVHEGLSECFEDGAITGLSAIGAELDYSRDPLRGDLDVRVLEVGKECLWDPHSRRYTLSDAQYFLDFKWVHVSDLIADNPERAGAIREAASALRASFLRSSGKSTSPPGDAYGSVSSHPIEPFGDDALFYDPDGERMLIIAAWYREPDFTWVVVDRQGGKPLTVDADGDPLTAEAARRLVAADEENLSVVRRVVRRVRMATVLPGPYLTLEDAATPYDNDDEHFPFAPFWVFRKGNEVWGLIRNLKDIQRVENKRWSQLIDILSKYAQLRMRYAEGSVLNPDQIQEPFSTAPIVYKYEAGVPSPDYLVPPLAEITRVLTEVAAQMRLLIPEQTGLNRDLLGIRADTTSGIAIAERKQQGQIISTRFFDNLRRTRKFLGERIAKRTQQRYTAEELLRLTHPTTGEEFELRVASAGLKGMTPEEYRTFRAKEQEAGRPRVLRDPSVLRYDVVISDIPATPTARAAKALALIEVAEKFPEARPALLPEILQLLDIPNRAAVLAKFQQMTGNDGQVAPAGDLVPGVAQPAPGLLPGA